jgi:hypothetical protein
MARTRSRNQHVIPCENKWAVRAEGNVRYTSVHKTQAEAISIARDIAMKQNSILIIHRRDGRVRDRERFTLGPLPPRVPREVLLPSARTSTPKRLIRKAVREVIANRTKAKSASEIPDK